MGMTLTEKIIAKHAGKEKVHPGEIVEVSVDYCMLNDVTIVMTKEIFEKRFGFKKVFDASKIVFIFDHRIPADDIPTSQSHQISREFAAKYGIKVHERDGVCHQVMFENYVKPGFLVAGADSHTCSYGSVGVVSVGMGSTDISAIMGTGKTWLKVPETIKVVLDGSLQKGVYAKDVILHVIKHLTSSGATYKTVNFTGELVNNLSISERFTLANMVIEAGGKSAMIIPDEKVKQAYPDKSINWDELTPDPDAKYAQTLHFNVSDMPPQVACPHHVDNVKNVHEVEGTKIDQAFLGACTNGRIDDLMIAAEILKGKKVHPMVRFLITPASVNVYRQALEKGLIDIFMESGAIVNHPGCSTCWGASQGSLAKNQTMISSANRNFKGRSGSSESFVYLASPATVTASAINGKITNVMKEI